MIEVKYAVRKDGFKEHPAVVEGLDLVDEEDQITHLLSLEDELDGEDILRKFSSLREGTLKGVNSTSTNILNLVHIFCRYFQA